MRFAASKLPPPIRAITSPMKFSWQELLLAAMTVGRNSWAQVTAFGPYSVYELSYRAFMIRANLRRHSFGLGRSPAFNALDRSEKSAVSYCLGLTCTKLLIERLLGQKWLMHYDNYLAATGRTVKGVRPDLLGIADDGTWVIVECKGRSGGFDAKAFDRALVQSKSVVGAPVGSLRIASEAYFAAGHQEELSIRIEDPEPPSPQVIRLDADVHVQAYYQTLLDILSTPDQRIVEIESTTAAVAALPAMDLEIGLVHPVLEALHAESDVFAHVKAAVDSVAGPSRDAAGRQAAGRFPDSTYPVAPDGIVIVLGSSWDQFVS